MMASGDKIYIADKETLDTVHQKVSDNNSGINTANAGITSLLNRKVSSDSFTTSNLSKLYYGSTTVSGSSGTINILNLTQPGTLYMVFVENPVSYQSIVQILVDNTTIYSSAYTAADSNQTYTGLITSPAVLGVIDNRLMLVNSRSITINNSPVLSPINRGYSGTNVFSFKPIKWNTSLIVRASVAGTGLSSISYYYELD